MIYSMLMFGDILFSGLEQVVIINFGCSPSQKHGGFFLFMWDIILKHCAKFQFVTNFFWLWYFFCSHNWTIIWWRLFASFKQSSELVNINLRKIYSFCGINVLFEVASFVLKDTGNVVLTFLFKNRRNVF